MHAYISMMKMDIFLRSSSLSSFSSSFAMGATIATSATASPFQLLVLFHVHLYPLVCMVLSLSSGSFKLRIILNQFAPNTVTP